MPVLKNAKHERFAQAVANEGMSASKAYVEAGYPAHRQNAVRLRTNDAIQARIDELLTQRLVKTVRSREWVLDGLQEVAERCMGVKGVRRNGQTIAFKFDAAAANRAYELIGKELGMFVDRVEQDTNIRVISAQPVTEEDWEARYVAQRPVIEGSAHAEGSEAAAEQAGSDSSPGPNGHRAPDGANGRKH